MPFLNQALQLMAIIYQVHKTPSTFSQHYNGEAKPP